MAHLQLDKLRAAKLETSPYTYTIVPGFLTPETVGRINATYPKIESEQWYLFQLIANGKDCLVRINGENVVDYHKMERTTSGPIMIQAHQNNHWVEYKEMRVKRLTSL